MRIFALLLTISFVAGCASMGAEKVEQLKPGSRVAVLSVLGSNLSVRHVGTIVFQNARRDIAVPQWQIDRHAEASAARHITRFQAVRADTADARTRAGKMGSSFWSMGPTLEGGAQSIIDFAKRSGADYVLVLGPNPAGDPFMRTNQSLSGYGIYQRAAFGTRRAINFLTMRVVLYDGRNGEEVARTQDHASSPRADNLWMEASKLALSDANAAATRAAIEQLIEATLQKNLAKLKLGR